MRNPDHDVNAAARNTSMIVEVNEDMLQWLKEGIKVYLREGCLLGCAVRLAEV